MRNINDKRWPSELKVVYLADFTSIKIFAVLLNPGWFSLIIIVSGTIDFMIGSSKVNLSAGDLYVIPSEAEINADFAPVRICLLSCTIDFAVTSRIARFGIGYMQALTSQKPSVLSLTQKETQHIISLFGLLKKKISSKNTIFQDEMVLLWVKIILYEYVELRYKYDKNFASVHYSEKMVMSFITLVQQNCKAHHKVAFYADCLYVSKGHLGKSVRSILGISVKYFIEMAVLSEAYTLLADHALSISEVADQLHFDSSSAFSAFFKKHTKFTPTQYRQSIKF